MQSVLYSRGLRSLGRGLLLVGLAALGLLALVAVLIVLEGQRDDLRSPGARRVAAAIVLAGPAGDDGAQAAMKLRLDHALDLYRRGQVRLVVLAGPAEAAEGLRYLAERGLPPEALRPGAGESLLASLRASADAVRTSGGSAAVLVGDPPQMLRALKIARDLGVEAYSSPIVSSPLTDGTARQAGFVLREAAAYLGYLFAQR